MTPVDLLVRDLILRFGPVSFSTVVELALYDPDGGFYSTVGRAGRGGDFLTSPEVGPLFGAVVARAIDQWWADAGEPGVFVVVEAGAGPGTLARSVLSAEPRCSAALRYVLVETSAAQRNTHAERLPLEDPSAAFASIPVPDDDVATVTPPPGPVVVSLAELPRVPGPCVVLANELLDNLPFELLERTADGWAEVCVDSVDGQLVEVLVPVVPDRAESAGPVDVTSRTRDIPVGARLPRQAAAARWVADAIALAGQGGRVVAFDYAASTAALARRPWTDWVRTYRQHQRGGPPLEALGSQDITCEVAYDQLGVEPTANRSQAEWLRGHGIEELVAEGRRVWRERAHLGDLAAIRARSRIGEADSLLDDDGMGTFRVLEWADPGARRPATGRDRRA